MNDTIKIALEQSYPYSDISGWYHSLSSDDKELWLHLAKEGNKNENNTTILVKKALELYCLEMDVEYLPRSEDFFDIIYRKFIDNLILLSLIDRKLINVKDDEKISMRHTLKFYVGEK